MNKLKKTLFVLFVLVLLFSSSSAHAYYNGEKSDNSPYVVHFLPSPEVIHTLLMPDGNDLRPQAYKTPWCSGTVIHPHIVITDAHCLYDDKINPTGRIAKGWRVSYPGVEVGTNLDKSSLIVETFFMDQDFYKDHDCPNLGVRGCSPIGDIAAVVIENPLPVPNNLKIATLEEIEKFRLLKLETIGYGYGLTEKTPDSRFIEMKINRYPLINYSAIVKNIRVGGHVPKRYNNVWPDFIISIEHKKNESGCSGDSGGPVFVKQDNYMYYIGTNAATNWDMCTDKNPRPSDAVATTWVATLAYHYDIYNKAINFVNTKLLNKNVEINSKNKKIKHDTQVKSIVNKGCKENKSTKSMSSVKFICTKNKNNKLVWKRINK